MPSGQYSLLPTKLCSSCQTVIIDPSPSLVCGLCRNHRLRIDQDLSDFHILRHPEEPVSPSAFEQQQPLTDISYLYAPSYTKKSVVVNLQCNITPPPPQKHHFLSVPPPESTASRHSNSLQDPLADVTRLRIRTRAHTCLYPGATFEGTQKSGRNSYDVNVTIVDVNFPSSTLCGYLRIRGLTDDWPELTTYFDAEIIGNRYGFLTQNWGATQNEDLVHWSRFPAFKHIRHDAKPPHLTLDDRERPFVFMRWKERFLVPDHRVQDINGASFAGFYYVCVDLNPPTSHPSSDMLRDEPALQLPLTPDSEDMTSNRQASRALKPTEPFHSRLDPSARRRPTISPFNLPVATMSGFYYHQNSEPYQQLTLTHIQEKTSTSFEFR